MIPALDTAAFEELVEDLGPDVASDFLTTFHALLPDRIRRIERALKAHDEKEITEAFLSLRAGAAMAGAAQLEASATRALAQHPTGSTQPGALVRKLQGQADLFRETLANFHHVSYTSRHPGHRAADRPAQGG